MGHRGGLQGKWGLKLPLAAALRMEPSADQAGDEQQGNEGQNKDQNAQGRPKALSVSQ